MDLSLIYLLVLLVGIWKMKMNTGGQFCTGYLSREQTESVNGVFTLLVFIRHIWGGGGYSGSWLIEKNVVFGFIDTLLGQLIVTTFLFYSGYGICESIKNKKNYIEMFPFKRILKLFMHFDFAIFLYMIENFIFHEKYSLSQKILSLFAWSSIGNSCWYIFVMLVFYCTVYFSFKKEKDMFRALISVSILMAIYALAISFMREHSWYNTVICLVSGMWYSFYRQKIENVICSGYVKIFCMSALIFTVAYGLAWLFSDDKGVVWNMAYIAAYWIASAAFVFIVIMITMKVKIGNPITGFLGRHVFSIYILQRLSMIIFYKIGLAETSQYLYFFVCLTVTIILAVLYDRVDKIYLNLVGKIYIKKENG